ncbi:MAG: hypothetical protein NVSMB21_07470 [Vulcanimicrobiaceae bacterium]
MADDRDGEREGCARRVRDPFADPLDLGRVRGVTIGGSVHGYAIPDATREASRARRRAFDRSGRSDEAVRRGEPERTEQQRALIARFAVARTIAPRASVSSRAIVSIVRAIRSSSVEFVSAERGGIRTDPLV